VDDKGGPLEHAEGLEQCIEKPSVLYEGVGSRTTIRQLVRITHADQVRCEATAGTRDGGNDVAPHVGRGGITVEEDDRVALPDLDVRYFAA
jgi:hypothetical protein